jgi:hypothetical protein
MFQKKSVVIKNTVMVHKESIINPQNKNMEGVDVRSKKNIKEESNTTSKKHTIVQSITHPAKIDKTYTLDVDYTHPMYKD